MMIGIDFDNTIICYDNVFNQVAVEKKLIPPELPSGKNHVRNYLRELGQEEEWINLQGIVYGTRLSDACPYEGVKNFMAYCQTSSIDVCIISHKTKHPYRGVPYDLHDAAYQWLKSENINCQIFFELTKEKKVNRISEQGCTHFIDDLPEFLTLSGFSEDLSKLLFDPQKNYGQPGDDTMRIVSSWQEILVMLKQDQL